MYPRVSQGRRILGITFDWLACYAIALGFFAGGGSLADRIPGARFPVLLLLFAEYSLCVALGGSSFGHRLVGLKVVRKWMHSLKMATPRKNSKCFMKAEKS